MLRCTCGLAAAVMSAAVAASASGQALSFQKVALTGDAAPGGAGVFRQVAGAPVINAGGTVAFEGIFNNNINDRGVIAGQPGALSLVLRSGAQVPGAAAGVTFGSANLINIGDSGVVALGASVAGTGITQINRSAILAGTAAGVQLVAQTNTASLGDAGLFRSLPYGPLVNGAGQYAFLGALDTIPSVHEIWMGGSQAPVRVVGESAPATAEYPAGSTFYRISRPSFSDTGRIAFYSDVRPPNAASTPGVFIADGGVIRRLAAPGDAVPGVAGATFTTLAVGGDTRGPSMNRAGDLVIEGGYTQSGGAQSGIWMSSSAQPEVFQSVTQSTQTLPGTPAGTTVRYFNGASINSKRSIAFQAELQTGGTINGLNNDGIWLSRNGVITPMVLEGQSVAQLPPGVALQFSSNNRYSLLNDRDQMVFVCGLAGPGVTAANGSALLGWDPDAGLMLLARQGDLFQVSAGVFRTVEFINFANSLQPANSVIGTGGTGGAGRGLNDSGMVVFGLTFTDGSAGVFRTTIPAPGAAASLALVLGAGVGRRRRA